MQWIYCILKEKNDAVDALSHLLTMQLEEANILEDDPLPPSTTDRICVALSSDKESKILLHHPKKITQLCNLAIDGESILEYPTKENNSKFYIYIPPH